MLKQIMYMHDCMFITHIFIKIKINTSYDKKPIIREMKKKSERY